MSITLTTGSLVVVNGTQIENNTTGGESHFSMDFLANTVSFELVQGTIQSGNINAGNYPPKITVTVNLTTGDWFATSGMSGHIPPSNPQLVAIANQFKADRNAMETFAAGASGIMPGTQVPWP
jgi:hypothetical protein